MIELRKTTKEDLEQLFIFQTDEQSNVMAAFTPKDPNDKDAYMKKWTGIITNPEIDMQTIFYNNDLVGSVLYFTMGNETNVSYWIDRTFWGKGIATKALRQFLDQSDKKTFYARAAYDNIGSQRVLEKCNFKKIALEKGFANARNQEIEEFVFKYES